MESILMEYVAIESQLEILLGVIGLHCNKFLDNKGRKDIKIFHRIEFSNYIFNNSKIFEKSKLNKKFYDDLIKCKEKIVTYMK